MLLKYGNSYMSLRGEITANEEDHEEKFQK